MYTKIAIVILCSLFLGGCTLTDYFQPTQSASDQQPAESTQLEDQALATMPQISTDDDLDSLEADLNSTVILEEDFSDLE